MSEHADEVAQGKRFEFGANWSRFLRLVNEERIKAAEYSLQKMLGVQDLTGQRFLDAGSGSGLFSLAASRLGATVISCDFDPVSVACTRELKSRYAADTTMWQVEAGSVLDLEYLRRLGEFDVVYSWGVLHHTGAMWQALENLVPLVRPGGRLFVALYNDQGFASRFWRTIKRLDVKWPPLRIPILAIHSLYPLLPSLIVRAATGRLQNARGMSMWRDLVDWVGGDPFEVATPGAVVEFGCRHGRQLTRLVTTNRHGCNEFVFSRNCI